MDINRILVELRAERNRIHQAISVLEAVHATGRPQTAVTRRRVGMSSAARRKLSRLLKQRWAQGKMQHRAKAKPPQAAKRARRMSKAARNRIAAAQRARWARVKSEQAKKTAA